MSVSPSNLPTNMQKLNDVLYIELFPDKLMELTYPEKTESDMRAFLITLMYNAPATIDSYYTAKVNHDMMHVEKH